MTSINDGLNYNFYTIFVVLNMLKNLQHRGRCPSTPLGAFCGPQTPTFQGFFIFASGSPVNVKFFVTHILFEMKFLNSIFVFKIKFLVTILAFPCLVYAKKLHFCKLQQNE